ncbi:SHOCT domain-containing protein [Streptomyces iconiensis]|uniref:SHOCT domain-containing protein n=1 Tax=Streptomyces iconiensis TaxID=1384038 RepID=A0ABT6ZQP1_9ACTN|nr:SHOCT domain-containing protein [Streptomyces iconiensis]MDJ1131373.1 SHOCT domain-containing protein [Streptomyces iconiensis]
METLAQWHNGGGPGPWVLFFPLIWAAVIGGGIYVLRRTVWRGRGAGPGGRGPRGPWGPPQAGSRPGQGPPQGAETPLGLLDRRFAKGEIDEDEYWRRYSVLNESVRERYDGTGDSADGAR